MRTLVILMVTLFFHTAAFAAYALPEKDKRAIVRIETPEGLGTGFLVTDSTLGLFLVTNKHVLQSQDGSHYFDSVFIRKNILDQAGKVLATDERSTVLLRYMGQNLYIAHPDSNIDIAVVQLGSLLIGQTIFDNPINPPEWFFSNKSSRLASRDDMKRLCVADGTDVEIIGFSFLTTQRPQFHIARFGHVSLFSDEKLTFKLQRKKGDCICYEPSTAEWIVIDITSRPGDSGGPVFAFDTTHGDIWIIGIVQLGSDIEEVCLAQPSYYILDLMAAIKTVIGK